MNELEQRTVFTLQVRALEGEKAQISGHFATFGQLSEPIQGFFKEKFEPGTFKRSLTDGREILAVDWHNLKQCASVIGSTRAGTYRLREDGQGLYGEIDPPDTSVARDLVANMKAGNVRGASIGFRDVKGGVKWSQDSGWDVRTVSDLSLIEGSVTAMPAYKSTALSARSLLLNEFEAEPTNLICRALNRVQHQLDIVDEDKDVLREYRSQLVKLLPAEQRALIDKLLEPARLIVRPIDVLTWADIAGFPNK